MMTAIMKKHLKKKKGFTLIEVVVVLVILAILAAIAVPALTGYISDAKDRAAVSEARTIYVALQHMANTWNSTDGGDTWFDKDDDEIINGVSADGLNQISKLTGIEKGKLGTIGTITAEGNTITAFVYTSFDGKTITYPQ